MIARKPNELTGPRDKKLTKEILLEVFTQQQLAKSTYSNRYGECIRLVNRYEEIANVPALYPYSQDIIEHFQSLYSNVGTFKNESQGHQNKILNVIFYEKPHLKYPATQQQPSQPLPPVKG